MQKQLDENLKSANLQQDDVADMLKNLILGRDEEDANLARSAEIKTVT
jgi:hypothetical protein